MAALETAGVDLEEGGRGGDGGRRAEAGEVKVHSERDCRICHLGLESNSSECGTAIELGCSCKNDLAAAHKHCAEAWFKIRGNKTCEICHSIVQNVGVHELEQMEQLHEFNNGTLSTTTVAASVAASPDGGRRFWQVHRVLNFLLACIVFAFVISWLFHFNMRS
ncbi:hypothetical protein SDJN03_11919, partial [Cucurbita argyrosperma subsp. sororia]